MNEFTPDPKPSSPPPGQGVVVQPSPEPQTPPVIPPNQEQPNITSGNAAGPDMTLPKNEHKAPVGAIIFAIIIAIGLAVLTVMAYQKTKSSTESQSDTTSESQQETTPEAEVDSTEQAVDSDINAVDDEQDFNSSDLSDESLNL